jgi:hypothetical protein
VPAGGNERSSVMFRRTANLVAMVLTVASCQDKLFNWLYGVYHNYSHLFDWLGTK